MIFVFHYDQRALTIKLRLSFFFLLTALCFLPPYQILSQSILDRVLLFFFHSLLNFHDAILIREAAPTNPFAPFPIDSSTSR